MQKIPRIPLLKKAKEFLVKAKESAKAGWDSLKENNRRDLITLLLASITIYLAWLVYGDDSTEFLVGITLVLSLRCTLDRFIKENDNTSV